MRDPAPVVCLMGPTAAGKTDVAAALVEHLPLAIVSVDSAMVYRGMDIGTGKPGPAVLARAPHRLIDIRDPADRYSAAEFREDARREIAAIRAAGEVPLLVGGTGLYFRALTRGLAALPPADAALRARLAATAAADGWAAMHARLAAVDPAAAARIHPNDPQRIQRALEVHELTGQRMSDLLAEAPGTAAEHAFHTIVLEPADRSWLHDRITRRFDAMLAAGLVGEVSALVASGRLTEELPAMRAVGYRQVWRHLRGLVSRDEMVRTAVVATRQLAKRQLTWLRSESGAARFDAGSARLVEALRRHLEPLLAV